MDTKTEIESLYDSGLSKRDICLQGFRYTDVKRYLADKTRSFEDIGKLKALSKKHTLNQNQLDLIYGSLLGDSSLSSYGPIRNGVRKKYTMVFSNSHCDAQHGYQLHMKEILPSGNIYTRTQKSGYILGVPVHMFSYRNKGALCGIWDVVMVNNKKSVNEAWINKLNRASVAYWFMDDGTSCFSGNSVVVRFSTHSFSLKEIHLLRTKLNEFGFNSFLQESKKGPVISLSKPETMRFMDFVSDTVSKVPCMVYKLKYKKC